MDRLSESDEEFDELIPSYDEYMCTDDRVTTHDGANMAEGELSSSSFRSGAQQAPFGSVEGLLTQGAPPSELFDSDHSMDSDGKESTHSADGMESPVSRCWTDQRVLFPSSDAKNDEVTVATATTNAGFLNVQEYTTETDDGSCSTSPMNNLSGSYHPSDRDEMDLVDKSHDGNNLQSMDVEHQLSHHVSNDRIMENNISFSDAFHASLHPYIYSGDTQSLPSQFPAILGFTLLGPSVDDANRTIQALDHMHDSTELKNQTEISSHGYRMAVELDPSHNETEKEDSDSVYDSYLDNATQVLPYAIGDSCFVERGSGDPANDQNLFVVTHVGEENKESLEETECEDVSLHHTVQPSVRTSLDVSDNLQNNELLTHNDLSEVSNKDENQSSARYENVHRNNLLEESASNQLNEELHVAHTTGHNDTPITSDLHKSDTNNISYFDDVILRNGSDDAGKELVKDAHTEVMDAPLRVMHSPCDAIVDENFSTHSEGNAYSVPMTNMHTDVSASENVVNEENMEVSNFQHASTDETSRSDVKTHPPRSEENTCVSTKVVHDVERCDRSVTNPALLSYPNDYIRCSTDLRGLTTRENQSSVSLEGFTNDDASSSSNPVLERKFESVRSETLNDEGSWDDQNRRASSAESSGVGCDMLSSDSQSVSDVSTSKIRTKVQTRRLENSSQDSCSDASQSDGDLGENQLYMSQRTRNIRRQLSEFAEVNVSTVVDNLLRSPAVNLKSLQEELSELYKENSHLKLRNKELVRKLNGVQNQVTTLTSMLDKERSISATMKSELDRLLPLVRVAVEISNSSTSNTSPMKSDRPVLQELSHAKVSSKKKRLAVCESDDDGLGVPRKILTSPKSSDRRRFKQPSQRRELSRIAAYKVNSSYETRKVAFSDIWRFLQTKGWSHRTGPEPYGKVYCPPGGSVAKGALIGRDFFHANDLYEKAEELGFEFPPQNISAKSNQSNPSDQAGMNNEEWSLVDNAENSITESSYPCIVQHELSNDNIYSDTDDTSLCGPSKALSSRSVELCGRLIRSYIKSGENTGFMRDVFTPMWRCLKDEQRDSWKYEKSRSSLSRSWCFVAPNGSTKGEHGKDYFTSEEGVVSFVIREIMTVKPKLLGGDSNAVKRIITILEEKASYEGIDGVHSDKRRPRRTTPKSMSDHELSRPKMEGHSPSVQFSKKKGSGIPADKLSIRSPVIVKTPGTRQYTPIETESNSSETFHGFTATRNGVKALLNSQQGSLTVKRKDIEQLVDASGSKRQRLGTTTPHTSSHTPTFHLTQSPNGFSQTIESIVDMGDASPKLDAKGIKKPLSGLYFFISGLSEETYKIIRSLGGSIATNLTGEALNPLCIDKKLFFISEPGKRRTLKYILAGALGVPMLHGTWISAMNRRYLEFKRNTAAGGYSGMSQPSPFDSDLYSSYRLPLGLSTNSGFFHLQKAKHAKKWCRPGCQNNQPPVFEGLTVSFALESVEDEKKWSDIFEAAGGNVLNFSSNLIHSMDILFIDSLSIPPHAQTITPRIAKHISVLRGGSKPIVDLSWVTQCIVQRQRVDLNDCRYRLNTRIFDVNSATGSENSLNLFSLKINRVRYEVMDIVRFGTSSETAVGRIVAIRHDKKGKKNTVEIQVMGEHNKVELNYISGNNVQVDETELFGHVLLLTGKDFNDVSKGWGAETKYTDLFVQMKS